MGLEIAVDDRDGSGARAWIAQAMRLLEAERERAAETPMFRLDVPELPGIGILVKDETGHPSGSLKHRLALALFEHGICNGDIEEGMTLVETASGASAISFAWFARALGLPFVAIVPPGLRPGRIAELRWAGCEVIRCDAGEDPYLAGFRVAAERGGHYLNRFARAADITDWRSSNSLATSLFTQALSLTGAAPDWVVVGAGTGSTSASLGRYMRYRPHLAGAKLCVVDPEGSAYFQAYVANDWSLTGSASRHVDGIGRPRVEASFCPGVVDQMLQIPDVASVAAMHWLEDRCGRRFGPSTGTNIVGALLLGHAMANRGETGTIVTLACSGGKPYDETLYSLRWLLAEALDITPWRDLPRKLAAFTIPDL